MHWILIAFRTLSKEGRMQTWVKDMFKSITWSGSTHTHAQVLQEPYSWASAAFRLYDTQHTQERLGVTNSMVRIVRALEEMSSCIQPKNRLHHNRNLNFQSGAWEYRAFEKHNNRITLHSITRSHSKMGKVLPAFEWMVIQTMWNKLTVLQSCLVPALNKANESKWKRTGALGGWRICPVITFITCSEPVSQHERNIKTGSLTKTTYNAVPGDEHLAGNGTAMLTS